MEYDFEYAQTSNLSGAPEIEVVSSYQLFLMLPISSLCDTSRERPDVASIAILGYN